MLRRISRVKIRVDLVISLKFWSALGLSVTLHAAVLGGLTWGTTRRSALGTPSASVPIDYAPVAEGALSHTAPPMLPVEVEPLAAPAGPAEPIRTTPQPRVPTLPRSERTKATNDLLASKEPRKHEADTAPPPSTENAEASGSSHAAPTAAPEPSVDRASLHRAMAAAATAASPGNSAFTQPVVRVDPTEKNLDRAFARAFAWAFAVDRSFFATTPVGKTRFVVELADDGRISHVSWARPHPPDRLKQLVRRMSKLLSVNRFSLPSSDGDASQRRAFVMTVTERRVAVPSEVAQVDGQMGDIWMLAAGETPTLGHPSHPSVADVTGHRIDCELEVLLPVPDSSE